MSTTTNFVPGSVTRKSCEIRPDLSVLSKLQYTEAASGSNAINSLLVGIPA